MKKIIAFLVLLVAFSMPVFGVLGDVNEDTRVDIVDALMVSQYYVGIIPVGFALSNSDVDGNGQTDILDALYIAQFYVGVITQFPGVLVPESVKAYAQSLAGGGWQDSNTAVTMKPATTAGRYLISIDPVKTLTYLPGKFVSAKFEVSEGSAGSVTIHTESFKPQYWMYSVTDGELFIEGLRLLASEASITTKVIDRMWRVRLAVQSLNNPAEIYIGEKKVSRDSSNNVTLTQMPSNGYTVFHAGLQSGVDPSITVTGYIRPELIYPGFYQINLVTSSALQGSNFKSLEMWITADSASTEILYGYMKPAYAAQLACEGQYLYAGLALWYKETGRMILHDYDPVVMMTRITLFDDPGTRLRFTDPDGLSWEVGWGGTQIDIHPYKPR